MMISIVTHKKYQNVIVDKVSSQTLVDGDAGDDEISLHDTNCIHDTVLVVPHVIKQCCTLT